MFWYFGKSNNYPKTKSKKLKACRGFTLLELIVVIAIFLIITGVVMTDIPNFRQKSALDLTASEVATYIRGAQVYGTAQRTGDGITKYGIHLATGPSTPNNFYLYKGEPASHQEDYQLNGYYIGSIKNGNNNDFDSLNIAYSVQTYTASFAANLSPVFTSDNSPLSDYYFKIEIRPIRGSSEPGKCIFVYKNGQITVNPCT